MDRDFPALHIGVKFLKIVAWITAALIALSGIIVVVTAEPGTRGYAFVTAIGCLVVAGLTWVFGMIAPELIEVLLAIEENTRPPAGVAGSTAPPPVGSDPDRQNLTAARNL